MKSSLLAIGLAVSLFSIVLLQPAAHSQARFTASRSQEVSVFGTASGGYTDFGSAAYEGMSAGVDYTFFFQRWPVAPSLEVRASQVLGPSITETAVQFGPRLQKDFRGRFHPYVDVLYGGSEVQFHPRAYYASIRYTGDRGNVLSYGGGINIDLPHHFGAKFDIQGENYRFGPSLFTGPTTDFTLSPIIGSVGLTYTLPFGTRNRRENFR